MTNCSRIYRGSKNECPQYDAEHQYDEKYDHGNIKQNLGDAPRISGHIGKTKESGNQRNQKENYCPLDHGDPQLVTP
jgi:hypothetical protein